MKNIEGQKLFLHPDRVSSWVSGESIAPIYIEVSPTSICNHKCFFCAPDYMKQNKSIDADILITALDELSDLGSGAYMVAGEGEPFLHKDILRILIEPALDMSITTNGVLATSDKLQSFMSFAHWIRFSVDAGTEATYALVHGTQANDFGKVIDNIKSAVNINKLFRWNEENSCDVDVQFLVLPENIYELPIFLDIMTQLGVCSIQIKPYSHNPKSSHCNIANYTKADIEFIEQVIGEFSDPRIIFRKESMLSYMEGSKCDHCYAMPFFAYIDSMGNYWTCGSMLGDERFLAGNIYNDSVRDIVYGKQLAEIHKFARYDLDVKAECRANCRLARMNEYLSAVINPPRSWNFV